MKQIGIFWALLLALPPLWSGDFRQFNWGDSKATVKKGEKAPVHHDMKGELAYWNFKIAGVEVGLKYFFDNQNKLSGSFYTSRHFTPVAQEDFQDYLKLRDYFDRSFGVKHKEERQWQKEAYKVPDDQIGKALAKGLVTLVAEWKYGNTHVYQELKGGKQGISLLVSFKPLKK